SATAHAGREGPRARHVELLRAVRFDPAMAADDVAHAGEGVEADPRGPPQARRALRMHPVRLLLDLVPELLVERRPLSWTGRALASQSLDQRQPRRGDRRAARQ